MGGPPLLPTPQLKGGPQDFKFPFDFSLRLIWKFKFFEIFSRHIPGPAGLLGLVGLLDPKIYGG